MIAINTDHDYTVEELAADNIVAVSLKAMTLSHYRSEVEPLAYDLSLKDTHLGDFIAGYKGMRHLMGEGLRLAWRWRSSICVVSIRRLGCTLCSERDFEVARNVGDAGEFGEIHY